MKISKEEALAYLKGTDINPSEYICKDCGNLAVWDKYQFSLASKDLLKGKDYSKEKFRRLTAIGVTFIQPRRIYNGHEYHLCYCYDCACKHFPEIPEKHFPLQPASFRSKFLYQISDEDFSQITSKVCKRTKEGYIERFGKEEGTKRWNSYCEKQSITNTFEYKQEKYGWTKEQFDEFNKSRSCTLENFIKRHGQEEGVRKWNEYCEIQRYTTTLEYFQKTYGKAEGKKKYEDYQRAKSPITLNLTSHSMIANEMFKDLSEHYKGNEIFTECLNKEWSVDYKYNLDYFDKTLNIVVEFYGDYWHCNPNRYKIDDIVEFPNNETHIVKEIWDKDKKRQEYIETKKNTKMFIVWEEDYRKNKKETLEKLIEDINKYVKIREYAKQSPVK